MKNREVLGKICMYDLLCRIIDSEDCCCVIDMIEHGVHPCRKDKNCKKCTADWLNEESKFAINERRQI